MDTRVTTKVFFNIAVLFVLILSVDCNLTKTRLQMLERKLATNLYEMSVLLQRTETIESRLSIFENQNKSTQQDEYAHAVESKDLVDESTTSAMYKAFNAEKLQRLKLEDKCEELENKLKQLQESSRMERPMMDEKINLLTRLSFQQTLNHSSILQKVEANIIGIGDIEEDMNTKHEILTHTLDAEAKQKQVEFNNKIAELQDDLSKKLEQYKSNAASSVEIAKLLSKAKVSFSARLGSSIADLEPEHTLRFDNIITNHGRAYSGTTGIFTAPMNGTFLFYVHILVSTRPIEIRLNKNDQGIMWLYAHGPGHGADGNMVVLELNEGDRINVVKNGIFGGRPFYVHPLWTTFSGFMLYSN